MGLFAAYNTIQNYVTSLLPGTSQMPFFLAIALTMILENLGNESLSILYGTVAISVVLAPVIVDKAGEKITMIFGAICYVAWMAALIKIVNVVVLLGAVVIGFGAAILWVAQGALLTRCSPPDRRGLNSGIFWYRAHSLSHFHSLPLTFTPRTLSLSRILLHIALKLLLLHSLALSLTLSLAPFKDSDYLLCTRKHSLNSLALSLSLAYLPAHFLCNFL